MDAYVYAGTATQNAVTTLASGVGNGGPARIVLPLTGDRALYVAVEAEDSETLAGLVEEVLGTSGLSQTATYIVDEVAFDDASFPTHAAVLAYLGFVLLDTTNPVATAGAAVQLTGVIGVAVVDEGATARVLVEVTRSSGTLLTTAMAAVEALDDSVVFTATGQTSQGTGF